MKVKYFISSFLVGSLVIGVTHFVTNIWNKPMGWFLMFWCMAGLVLNGLIDEKVREGNARVHLTINLLLSSGLLGATLTTVTGYSKGYLEILFFVVYGNVGFIYTTLFMVTGALCILYLVLNLAVYIQQLHGLSTPKLLQGFSPLNCVGFALCIGYILAWLLYT